MMVGLQGSGKTTTAAKLARKLKAEGRSTRLVAADVYRPAAIDQLETLGRDLGIPVYADRSTTDVVKIARAGVAEALHERDRVVIIDTAGRLQIDDAMMQELSRLKDALRPSEILLVADGMTGQDAVKIAQGFDEALNITGVVLTKMDGDARGGAALSIYGVTKKPDQGISSARSPMRWKNLSGANGGRILQQGDIVTLVEKGRRHSTKPNRSASRRKSRRREWTSTISSTACARSRKWARSRELKMLPGVNTKALKQMKA
jgi:signal recognition particle subunit SRP54